MITIIVVSFIAAILLLIVNHCFDAREKDKKQKEIDQIAKPSIRRLVNFYTRIEASLKIIKEENKRFNKANIVKKVPFVSKGLETQLKSIETSCKFADIGIKDDLRGYDWVLVSAYNICTADI